MIFKSLIAGTVLSALAGGVVYYGTDVDLQSSATLQAPVSAPQISDKVLAGESLHPHEASDKPRGAGGKAFKHNAKIKTLIDERSSEDVMIDDAETMPSKSQKWADKYVKPGSGAAYTEDAVKDEANAEIDTMLSELLEETDEIIEATPEPTIESGIRDEAEAEIDTMLSGLLGETDEIIEIAPQLATSEPLVESTIRDEANAEIDTMLSELLEETDAPEAPMDSKGHHANGQEDEKTAHLENRAKHKGKNCKLPRSIPKAISQSMIKPDRAHKDKMHPGGMHKDGMRKDRMHKDGMHKDAMRKDEMHKDRMCKDRMRKMAHMKNGHCSPAQVSATIDLITQEALKIELPELRDRAYLDLVSFALEHRDYDSARAAIDGIDQVELRDTARNRMAIAYAKHGQAKAAFELLEELEVKALSDVIRLQVIESIISPESLPKGHP